jgi:holo-[acyl-carrier protein] synthase
VEILESVMIEGIGVDIIEVDRMKQTVEEYGEAFLRKVFTPTELKYSRTKKNVHHHLAARFAAKEAFSKALATGWSGPFRWRDVEVSNDRRGKPSIMVKGRMKKELEEKQILLSISHSERAVVAVVLIEKSRRV